MMIDRFCGVFLSFQIIRVDIAMSALSSAIDNTRRCQGDLRLAFRPVTRYIVTRYEGKVQCLSQPKG